ncbi:hypothetical protein D3C76_746860 [compost metagenome]|uniref:Uncharacterized protein n=3 Tax=Pseudomonas TaxID=286 RepID=A0A7L9GCU7_9PSED|nr:MULTISPECIES: hypothetical protein [Pseudomonas]AFK72472.1 hypothetical protein YSA_10522 [Pseudomonas putida ND6]ANI03505.1 hypothetical protein A210_12960 [Pseudomonas putida SJTE-1]QLJ16956.1 hypothetical protein H0H12_13920 [Pseudomonas putida]QOJ90163.1 hypothetical protein ICN73_20125 [Pseudomonas taiwanensis]WQQ39426.1 hypothetical protein SO572_12545 [Pseudomonas putida]
MSIALALYGIEGVTPRLAMKFAKHYFSCLNLSITGAAYFKYLSNGGHVGDHDLVMVDMTELEEKINNGLATAFRVYNEAVGAIPWSASFGYTTNDFGGFYHFDGQCSGDVIELERMIKFIKDVCADITVQYGMIYKCDRISKAFSYAAGNNMVTMYPCENSSAFKKKVSGRFQGRERYKESLLRMVYPVNIISNKHLEVDVGGMLLKDWIGDGAGRGSLEALTSSTWLWYVQVDQLEDVNKSLGEAGILISWKRLEVKKRF